MKKLPIFLALISLAILFNFSCKKEKNDVPSVDYGSSSSSLRTTVTGIVHDESNAPLNGVTVTAYGQTTTTNQYGTFVLKNINANKDRCVLQFSKTGFFNRAHGFMASANTVNYVRIILLGNAATQSFSSSVGGLISLPDGSSAAFQPNSFVTSNGTAYTGTVNLIVKHLSPDDVNFGFTIPGGDLAAVNANNENVVLYTYGMLGVELTGNSGEALQLASGSSATLTMTIAASQLSSAPATIPLWYFNETTSLWEEEGSANKVGNNYVGTVNHFTWWNCDYGNILSFVKGKVVDCNGVGMPNVVISLNGWGGSITNQNGEYNEIFISGATSTMALQVLSTNNNGFILNSQIETVPSLSPNQTYQVPDLVIPCITKVIGAIKSCSGEGIDGFVSVSNSSFYCYQYTANGTFNLPAADNVQAVLYAFNSAVSHSQNITTLSAPNNLNVGNLLLCDSINVSANTFVLSGSGFFNQAFNLNMTFSEVIMTDTFGMGAIQIYLMGTAPPNFNISNYQININDTVLGTTICYLQISMADPTNNYLVYGSNVACNLTQVGSVGNKIKGEYYGVVYTSVNGGSQTAGNISGSFDVERDQ